MSSNQESKTVHSELGKAMSNAFSAFCEEIIDEIFDELLKMQPEQSTYTLLIRQNRREYKSGYDFYLIPNDKISDYTRAMLNNANTADIFTSSLYELSPTKNPHEAVQYLFYLDPDESFKDSEWTHPDKGSWKQYRLDLNKITPQKHMITYMYTYTVWYE